MLNSVLPPYVPMFYIFVHSFASVSFALFGRLFFLCHWRHTRKVRLMPDLQRSPKTRLPVLLYHSIATDVLPALSRPPNQTAVNHSQGCPGNVTMENSCEFPCAKGFGGKQIQRWGRFFAPKLKPETKATLRGHTWAQRPQKDQWGRFMGSPLPL